MADGNSAAGRSRKAADDTTPGLTERQRRVLVRRYGLDGETPATLADLSEELAVSRERVRQLQREAERILRDEGDFGHDLPAAA